MAYRRNATPHPEVIDWCEARIAAGHGETSARQEMRNISSLINLLGVEPHQLPEDAVGLASEAREKRDGKPFSDATARKYQSSLKAWRRWLDSGSTMRYRPGPAVAPRVTDQDLHDFAKWLSVTRNKADGTVFTYTSTVQAVAKFADCFARDLYVEDVREYIDAAIARAKRRGEPTIKNSYRQHLCKAIRAFCLYMDAEVMDFPDLTRGIDRGGRSDSVSTPPISEERFFDLLELADQESRHFNPEVAAAGRTMRALTKIMGFSGLRISEACQVTPAHLLTEAGNWYLRVPDAKGRHGNTDDKLLVDDIVVEELTMNWGQHEMVTPGWDPKTAGQRWTGWTIRKRLPATPHQLRVFYASWLYVANDYDILMVRDQLRHKSIATTEMYVKDLKQEARMKKVTSFGARMLEQHRGETARRSSVTPLRVIGQTRA